MKLRVFFFTVFLLFPGLVFADTHVATQGFVNNMIKVDTTSTNNDVVIQNNSTAKAKLNAPTTAYQDIPTTENNEVVTVSWVDNYRASKVRSGTQQTTDLVDMWVE